MRRVYYFALRKTGGADAAEELAAEVNLAVTDRLSRGDKPENFTAWVNALARNCWNRWAQRAIEGRENTLGADVSDIDPADDYSVEDDALRRDTLSIMRRELAFCASEYRNIIVAFYIDDRRVTDVAQELNLPVGTVKRKLSESRKLLKEGMNMSREFGPKSYKPENVRFTGAASPEGFPPNAAVERKIPKNLVLEASENPCSAEELAIALGIALPYIEEEIELLIKADLMKKVGNKYVSNIFIADLETQNKLYAMLGEDTEERNALARQVALDSLPTLRAAAKIPDGFTDSDLLWFLLPSIATTRVQTLALDDKYNNAYLFGHPDGTKWFLMGYEENPRYKFLGDSAVLDGISGLIWDYADGKRFCYNNFTFNDINRGFTIPAAEKLDGFMAQSLVFENTAAGFYAQIDAHPQMKKLGELYHGYFDRASEMLGSARESLGEQADYIAGLLVGAAFNLVAAPIVESAVRDGVLVPPEGNKRVALWFELR
jgi:RNA polymerase sigma factor (sigma-70 family)